MRRTKGTRATREAKRAGRTTGASGAGGPTGVLLVAALLLLAGGPLPAPSPGAAGGALAGALPGAASHLTPGPAIAAAQETGGGQDLEAAADSAFEAGDRERARALYRRVLQLDPDDQRVLLRLGLLAGWQDDYEESLGYLDRLLELNPDRTDALLARARVLAWSGRRDEAVEALRDVLRDRPEHVATRETLARILGWEERDAEAAEVLEPAVRAEPGNLALWEALAEAYVGAEQYGRAEETYRRMLERAEGEEREFLIRLRLADLQRLLGREGEARRTYRELVDEVPSQARLALGRLAMEDGDYVGAERQFRLAVEADPENVEARVALARVLRWQGRNRSALDELREAREMEEGAGPADWRWASAMVAPRVRISYGAGHDSDGNDMASLDGSVSFPLSRNLEVSAGATWQDNVQETDEFRIAREAVIGDVGLRWKSDLGWSVGVEAGRTNFLRAEPADATNVAVSASTPSRNRLALDATFESEILDYTAVLMREGVRSVGGDLSARYRPGGGWEVSGGAALAEFRGPEGDNARTAGELVVGFPRWGPFSVAVAASSYSFEKDLTDGYYDPDLYAKGELVARWDDNPVDWLEIGLEASPGYRYSRNAPGLEGEWDPTIGGEADVAVVFEPGRRIQFRSSYSKSDPASLGAAPGEEEGYEYWSVRIGLVWTL